MKKYFILFAILIQSCVPEEKGLDQLEAFMINFWSDASRVTVEFPEAFSAQKSIVYPPMTWKSLLKVERREETYCLFYRIPHKRLTKGRGVLKITKISKPSRSVECLRFLERGPELILKELSHLKLYFTNRPEKNLKLKTEYKPFHLYLSLSKKNEGDRAIVIPIFNVTSSTFINPNKIVSKTTPYKKYEGPWLESLYPGLRIHPVEKLKTPEKKVKYNYAEKLFKFCYRVDRDCKVSQEFSCNSCSGGWYSIVDYRCEGGGSKLCGQSSCGQRNQPACPRGELQESAEGNSFCFRGSKAGFCKDGLETYCDENKVLVCR